ncbi:MAG: hypothetical protein ABI759_13070 [Candidatus Solibacter sp.]
MNPDAFVLALLAIVDLSVIVHLRQRHARRMQMERVMLSLKFAVQRANQVVEEIPVCRRLPQAS